MNEIDFLPVDFRKKSFDRKDQRRQALIVGSLFLIIGVSYTYQRTVNANLAHRVEQARHLHSVTLRQFQELHDVEADLVNLGADAQAIAYLDHPWPQTQVVAMVVNQLPEPLTLTQLRIVRVPNAAVQRRRDEGPPPGQTALARDETVLRARYDSAPYQMIINGVTRDNAKLHEFMVALDRHDLVQRAELTSLDGVDDSEGEFEFIVTCSLAPGYGLPDGPQSQNVASGESR